MIKINSGYVRVVPQVYLEAVKLGPIEAREAFTDLVLDAEILVDDAELAKIKTLPDIKQVPVVAPDRPAYKAGDWRAKGSEMRNVQWKQKPVIDYIANTYKDAVMKAVGEKLSAIPENWRSLLMTHPQYRLEAKGLQLSPTEDKQWKSVFVQVVLPLGDVESGGFLGGLAQEFEQALANNQVQEAADGLVWKSSLTGLDSLFKSLDPFAGTKASERQIHGQYVARWGEKPEEAEPGYDLNVKEGMMDQIQNVLNDKLVDVMGADVQSVNVGDDGVFVIKANPPEPSTEPERVADNLEEPPTSASQPMP